MDVFNLVNTGKISLHSLDIHAVEYISRYTHAVGKHSLNIHATDIDMMHVKVSNRQIHRGYIICRHALLVPKWLIDHNIT